MALLLQKRAMAAALAGVLASACATDSPRASGGGLDGRDGGTDATSAGGQGSSAGGSGTGGSGTGGGGSGASAGSGSGGAARGQDGGGDSSTILRDAGVSISIGPATVVLNAGASTPLVATVSNDPSNRGVTWSVTGPGTVDAHGVYSAPPDAPSATVIVTARSNADRAESASATVWIVGSGQVVPTANLLVAKYTVTSPIPASVVIQFGLDTSYGLVTGTTSTADLPASVLVAGMRPGATYHMRSVLTFADGSHLTDVDHTFTTGVLPVGSVPTLTVTTAAASTPQSGIEMIDLVAGATASQAQIIATDLAGNVIWYYGNVGTADDTIQPIQALPNGNYLVQITPGSEAPFRPPPSLGTLDTVREIDLAGNTVRELNVDDLNARLPAAAQSGCAECGFVADVLHHDAIPLPNGHWLVMVNTTMQCSEVPGCTGWSTGILGDVIVDLDANLEPVWAWNEFNHLDVNRRPYQFPDWTHSNAVLYSPGDGNLLVSIRHQSWVVKVDYRNGSGNGDVIWRLGLEGDFTLQGSTSPADWFNAQHEPAFTTASTTGKFSMIFFDNGTYRPFPASAPCGGASAPCLYSTVPILDIDEGARTAKVGFRYPSPAYSFWGGNAEVLANGHVEFDVAGAPNKTGVQSDVYEVTQSSSAEVVWRLNVKGRSAYRAHRMPSLYPGVAW